MSNEILHVFSKTRIKNLRKQADGIFDEYAITNYNNCDNEIGELLVGSGVWDGSQLNVVSVGSNDL